MSRPPPLFPFATSTIAVWLTLAACLVAWRCNAEDFKAQSDKILMDGRLDRVDGRLERIEARLDEIERAHPKMRLEWLERDVKHLEARRP